LNIQTPPLLIDIYYIYLILDDLSSLFLCEFAFFLEIPKIDCFY
jgi:hypothetical protein